MASAAVTPTIDRQQLGVIGVAPRPTSPREPTDASGDGGRHRDRLLRLVLRSLDAAPARPRLPDVRVVRERPPVALLPGALRVDAPAVERVPAAPPRRVAPVPARVDAPPRTPDAVRLPLALLAAEPPLAPPPAEPRAPALPARDEVRRVVPALVRAAAPPRLLAERAARFPPDLARPFVSRPMIPKPSPPISISSPIMPGSP